MSKKFWLIFSICILAIILGFIIYFFFFNNSSINQTPYTAERTSTEENIAIENNSLENSTSTQENVIVENNNTNQIVPPQTPTPKITEESLSEFSTNIVTHDNARQNNINITCNKLNGITVRKWRNFFFL